MTDAGPLPPTPASGPPAVPEPSPLADPRVGLVTVHYSQRQTQRARDMLARLNALQRAVRFYPIEHPAVRESAHQLEAAVREFHEEGVEVQLVFFEGEILLGDQFLAEESIIFSALVEEMAAAGVGSLSFRPGVTIDEMLRAGRILGTDPHQIFDAGGVVKLSEEEELPHVRFGVVMAAPYGAAQLPGEERAFLSFAGAVDLIEQVDESVRRGGSGMDPLQVRGTVRSLVDGVLRNRYSMLQLTGLKNFDKYTFYHSANVAILSIALGSAVSHNEEFLAVLGTGALLHDVGKLAVGHGVLNKGGQLTPEEWDEMRSHPARGAEMVSLMPGIDKAAIVPVLEHHMRWDGQGYPARVTKGRQHITSRIVAIADSYDAMTSRRTYSSARTQEEAISLIVQGAGSAFDPVLARVFLGMLGVYPPLSMVRLASGEAAVVLRPADKEPLRPVVRVISAPDGELIEPFDVALASRPDLSIVASLEPRLINVAVEDYISLDLGV